MRIVIATNSLWNFLKFRKNLAKILIKCGHHLFVLSDQNDCKLKIFRKVKFIKIPIKRNPYNFFHDLILIYKFYKLFKIYHINFFFGFSHKINIYGAFVCKILKLKNILNITGLGTAFIDKNFLRFIILNLYKLSKSISTYFLFHNYEDKKLFLENSVVNNHNSAVIPGSGIDTSLRIKKTIKKNKYLTFTFIGRLIYQKGIGEFIEAAQMLLNSNIYKKNIIFKIIGEQDNSNISSINNDILNDIKKNKNFILTGHLNEKNVFKEIVKSDCIVLPSYREGLPRAILEAFLHSKPVITTDVPGCNRLVKNNFNGLLCKSKNVKSLFNTFKKFIQMTKKKRNVLGLNGRKFIIKNFNEELVIKKYLKLLKNV